MIKKTTETIDPIITMIRRSVERASEDVARVNPERLQIRRDTESDFEEYVGEISDEEFNYYTGQRGGRYFT